MAAAGWQSQLVAADALPSKFTAAEGRITVIKSRKTRDLRLINQMLLDPVSQYRLPLLAHKLKGICRMHLGRLLAMCKHAHNTSGTYMTHSHVPCSLLQLPWRSQPGWQLSSCSRGASTPRDLSTERIMEGVPVVVQDSPTSIMPMLSTTTSAALAAAHGTHLLRPLHRHRLIPLDAQHAFGSFTARSATV